VTAPLIVVRGLGFDYPDGTPALRDVNLEIGAREFIALVGQNGSGKTTLAKCLCALLRPTSGSVSLEGLDTRGRGIVKRVVTKVGYVFQNPDHQLFNTSVYAEIAYGPRNIGLPRDEVDRRVREAAQVCGVRPELLDQHPFFLTKGLRQRVAIASVLALKPRTIIVDEPTTGQDRRQSLEVMNFLTRLWEEEGHTVIIVTHEMPIVGRYARRVVALGDGRVLLDGETRGVFAAAATLARTSVAPPQITRFAQAVDHPALPRDVLQVTEAFEAMRGALTGRPLPGAQR
jgi:energy-coupling factor transport system ATP-binding protein